MISGLAKRLKNSRINAGLSRKEVGDLIGVTEATVGMYETGARQPSLYALTRLASILNVTTDYLLGCESKDADTISLSGLTEEQITIVKMTIQNFRNQPKE